MKRIFIYSVLLLFCAVTVTPATAQKKNREKREKEEKEMPPPMEELKEARMDTAVATEGIKNQQFDDKDFFFLNVDTTAPPDDELTHAIRNLLVTTGAVDLGVQFAKSMQQDKDNDAVPAVFYERMYKELTEGASRRYMEDMVIKVYRKYFTLEDINALNVFYSSPVGKKALSAMPGVLKDSQESGRNYGKMLGMKIWNDLVKEGLIK